MKRKREEIRIEGYVKKTMQSELLYRIGHREPSMVECKIDARKVSAIINMQEQMIETRGWKVSRGMNVPNENCRLFDTCKESVIHILAGCKVSVGSNLNI